LDGALMRGPTLEMVKANSWSQGKETETLVTSSILGEILSFILFLRSQGRMMHPCLTCLGDGKRIWNAMDFCPSLTDDRTLC
jgi:hypothetical protein